MSSTNKPGRTGLSRILHAAGYSAQGLRYAWVHEAAFRQELLLVLVLTPVALWLANTGLEAAMLILPLGLVLIAEIANSAIEAVVDRFGDERHTLSGAAKDMGSAAVFIALVFVAVCWILVLLF